MRQRDAAHAHIKALVDLFRQSIGVDEAVLAGRALAGDDGAHLFARAAGSEAVLCQKVDEGLDIFVFDPLDLDGEADGHGDFARAEFFARLCDGALLRRGDLAVFGDDAGVEHVAIALVL